MVSLVDLLVDLKKTVTIRGRAVEVEGVNLEKLGFLISEFPELRMLFAGRGGDLKPETIIAMGPRIVASVIAAGMGETGNQAAESLASHGGQSGFAAILKLTPRTISALLQLQDRRRLGEQAE